jgi:hypothetical protein
MTPSSLTCFFDPTSSNPAAVLHPIERRVQRGEREAEVTAGSLLDELRDLVAVMTFLFENGQDDNLGAPLFGLLNRAAT